MGILKKEYHLQIEEELFFQSHYSSYCISLGPVGIRFANKMKSRCPFRFKGLENANEIFLTLQKKPHRNKNTLKGN